MKRVLVDRVAGIGERIAVPAEEAHHLTRVRRSDDGEPVEALDGCGNAVRGQLLISGKQVFVVVEEPVTRNRETPGSLSLVLGLPSSRQTIDQILPGLVQLGVQQVHLVPVEYGGRIKGDKEKYLRRLEEIARQSLKQSGRLVTPQIQIHKHWQALVSALQTQGEHHWLCHPTGDPIHGLPRIERAATVTIYIGPEGGFSKTEVEQAVAIGIQPIDLGPRILKMETAAVAVAGWLQFQRGSK